MDKINREKLIFIFKETFDVQDIELIKNMSKDNSIKWDSLAVVSMIATISDSFSIEINPNDFEKFISYRSIEEFLEDKGL
tara:strand:- start:74 stop:313 length:240 start_codon:yes stop_codon:yes gene_type:complete